MMGMKLTGIAAERIKGIEGEALDNLVIKSLRDLIMKASDASPLLNLLDQLYLLKIGDFIINILHLFGHIFQDLVKETPPYH